MCRFHRPGAAVCPIQPRRRKTSAPALTVRRLRQWHDRRGRQPGRRQLISCGANAADLTAATGLMARASMNNDAAGSAGDTNARYLRLQARALVTLAACAVTAVLWVCHEAFVPVALSLLFALVLSSAVEALHRHGMPRGLSAVLMLLMLLTIIVLTFEAVAGPAQPWFAGLPQTLQTIERKVRPVQKALSRIEQLTSRADALASANPAPQHAGPQ